MRIGLYKYREFHDAILRPVFDALRGHHDCLLTGSEAELIAHRPHVVIMGESVIDRLRTHLPCALFVHTRHGLASKNVTYKGAAATDYMCVTSDFVRDWYLGNGAKPRRDFWVIGYLQMDPLFRNAPLPRPVDVPAGRKTILYAPTWNPPLSSGAMLGPQLVELMRGRRDDVSIVIKPHPLIATHAPEWMEWWRGMAASDPHVHLVEQSDADVTPFLQMTDVLVTDASSVQLEFLATDRPMILISNPQRFGSGCFDPRGFEWTWRDMGEEISDVADLPAAVEQALTNPAARAEQRARYRQMLFGDLTDGRTLERLCERVDALRWVAPRVAAAWVAGWPIRKVRGLQRRMSRLARGNALPDAVCPPGQAVVDGRLGLGTQEGVRHG